MKICGMFLSGLLVQIVVPDDWEQYVAVKVSCHRIKHLRCRGNRIFKGRLIPGATIGMHTHDDSCEVIFILEGCGTILEKEPGAELTGRAVGEGDCLYCPKGHTHSLMNTSAEGDLVFYAVVPKQ